MMHPHRHPNKPVGPIAKRFMLDHRIGQILTDFSAKNRWRHKACFILSRRARGQALHQDNFYLRVKPGTCMAAWIAIDDAPMKTTAA